LHFGGDKPVSKRKVYAYITHEDRLLVFRHVDFPEAGIQIPGGTVEPGESYEAALEREVREETGLEGLKLCGLVGKHRRETARASGMKTQQVRFYRMELNGKAREVWQHTEEHASDGSGPLLFEFAWVKLDDLPTLAGGQGQFVEKLKHRE
jgi:8-oxo-dGTP diphosphatase